MTKIEGYVLARWQAILDRVDCSPLMFYEMVEASLTQSELPNLKFSHITRNEGGWLSPKRIYLRVQFKRLYFDVYAFVLGDSLITGWWLHQDTQRVTDLFAEIPGIGFLLGKTTRAATYYQVDLVEYVERTVHASVLQIVDQLSAEHGLEYLPDEARSPIWEEIW